MQVDGKSRLARILIKKQTLVFAVISLGCIGSVANANLNATLRAPSSLECRLEASDISGGRQKQSMVVCDYRYVPTFKPSQLTLEVGKTRVRLDRDNIKKYPAAGQTTALFAMFDVSDPRRNATTVGFYPKIVSALVENRSAHLVLGIATFAQSLDVSFPLQPLSPISPLDNLPFSSVGAATELNRAALSALQRLDEARADRRILLIISDGKAEDTAYKFQDVISEASKRLIPIVTLGIAERPSESPALQSLRVMAEQSGGIFIDLSDKNIPANLQERILSLVDVGGRIAFDGSAYYGKQTVSVNLIDSGKKTIKVQADFEFPDVRETPEKVSHFLMSYWWALFLGAVGVAVSFWGFIRYRRLRRKREIENRLVAEFRGLDGDETRYEVRKAAVTLGRAAQNDIVITNSSVSGRHAELHRTREGLFRLSDLGSTNGTMVNGVRVTAIDIHDGDIIELAEVRLQFKVFD